MCGICGVYNSDDQAVIQRMCNAMIHRGPDDEGLFGDGQVALGVRRLAILDLSPGGHQPMSSLDGTVHLAYNGEIYNYRELNEELCARGHQPRSHCDTETILHAYQSYGIDCLQKLRGMFALAIWDQRRDKLFLARDRLGIKPLYYARVGQRVVFASEVKALLASGLIAKEIDPLAVNLFLTFGSVPAPFTMFKAIRMLLPGHYAVIDDNGLRTVRYWNVEFPETYPQRSEADWAAELRERLTDAVRVRLLSDVPLGTFLSGGVDSAAITGLMSSMVCHPVKTYSIDFDRGGAAYNETDKALRISRLFGTDHTQLTVSGADLARELPHIIRAMDQPTHDGINTYFVSKLAKTGVTVALSGLGADELFGGYSTFKFAARLARYRQVYSHVPRAVGRTVSGLMNALPARYDVSWPLRGAAGMLNTYPTVADQYELVKGFFPAGRKAGIVYGGVVRRRDPAAVLLHRLLAEVPDADVINQVSYLEIKTYLAYTLLRDTDAMSMASSLEARVPFLDHPLVEFVANMPPELKVHGTTTKYILKQALEDLLPADTLQAPKMGFGLPMAYWMREPPLRGIIDDCLSPGSVAKRGLLSVHGVEHAYKTFYDSTRTDPPSYQLYERVWMLTVLELWCRSYLDA